MSIFDEWQEFLQSIDIDSDDGCSDCENCEFYEDCKEMAQPDENGNIHVTPDLETYLIKHHVLVPCLEPDNVDD